MSDELKKGNNHELGTFFQQHAQYCCQRLCAENTCSIDDARDFFVESVMSLRERIIRDPEVPVMNVRAFLFKACQNMFRSSVRRKAKEQKAMSDMERYYYESPYLLEEQQCFDHQLLSITLRAWSALSERCQDLLHYFYVDRLKMKEIARLMGLANEDVAKSTKARCYKTWVAKALAFKEEEKPKEI